MDGVRRNAAVEQPFRMQENQSVTNLLENEQAFKERNSGAHDVKPVIQRSLVNWFVNELNALPVLRGTDTQ